MGIGDPTRALRTLPDAEIIRLVAERRGWRKISNSPRHGGLKGCPPGTRHNYYSPIPNWAGDIGAAMELLAGVPEFVIRKGRMVGHDGPMFFALVRTGQRPREATAPTAPRAIAEAYLLATQETQG